MSEKRKVHGVYVSLEDLYPFATPEQIRQATALLEGRFNCGWCARNDLQVNRAATPAKVRCIKHPNQWPCEAWTESIQREGVE